MTINNKYFLLRKAAILLVVFFSEQIQAFIPNSLPYRSSRGWVSSVSPTSTSSGYLQAASLEVDISSIENATELEGNDGSDTIPSCMLELPRHENEGVNQILIETEQLLRSMHKHSKTVDMTTVKRSSKAMTGGAHDIIYSNTYVDLGKVDTVGFDYDYTLVTYTDELLELIYDMALKRLVNDRYYPTEMLNAGMKFDPFFSIRGLAVDKGKAFLNCITQRIHF